jgi:hypothetical protein
MRVAFTLSNQKLKSFFVSLFFTFFRGGLKMFIVHNLKSWPQFFKSLLDESRPIEIRQNDRNFLPGDSVVFTETPPPDWVAPALVDEVQVRRTKSARISAVFVHLLGLPPDFCVLLLDFRPLGPSAACPDYSCCHLPAASFYYDAGGLPLISVLVSKLTPQQLEGYILGCIIKYALRMNFKKSIASAYGPVSSDESKLATYSAWLDLLSIHGPAGFLSRICPPPVENPPVSVPG